MPKLPLLHFELESIIEAALREDLAQGDITTNILISEDAQVKANICTKQDCTLAGMVVAQKVFEMLNASLLFQPIHEDGTTVDSGTIIAIISGNLRAILMGERIALNFLQHLSGIASMTAKYCEAIKEYPAKILDTRKTTPGLRMLEKWAVLLGGGTNHRLSLSDGILIKDTHLTFLNSKGTNLMNACRQAKQYGSQDLQVCVEVETLEQIPHALEGKADVLLLDNMTPEIVSQAAIMIKGQALIEVSGGIDINNIRKFAACGVDYISVGAITHSAPSIDMSLELDISN